MLPSVQFPRIVEQQATWFDPVFSTDEQRKHFREYVTGLIVGDEATVTAINQLFLGHNDQSSLNKFATLSEWDENELNRQRVRMELARLLRHPVSAEAGRLIIDDTLAHPYQVQDGWVGLSLGPCRATIRLGQRCGDQLLCQPVRSIPS